MQMNKLSLPTLCNLSSYFLIGIGLIAIFYLHLLPCFLAGFILYEVLKGLTTLLERLTNRRISSWVSVFLLGIVLVISLVTGIAQSMGFIIHELQSPAYIHKIATKILVDAQNTLSPVIIHYMPSDIHDLQRLLIGWIREHLDIVQKISRNVVHIVATVLIGMFLAVIIYLRNSNDHSSAPLKKAILLRLNILASSFHSVVFAQIQVSFLNTILTSLFIFVLLPLFDIIFPFSKTVMIMTFIAGLIPIIGNLISNFVILLIGLSISLEAAFFALVYLVVIHKLEYFVNAKIFGGRINASAWEILLSILVFESAFGLAGVIAAPIYYAYIKAELRAAYLV